VEYPDSRIAAPSRRRHQRDRADTMHLCEGRALSPSGMPALAEVAHRAGGATISVIRTILGRTIGEVQPAVSAQR
jgi:hypothetical protein